MNHIIVVAHPVEQSFTMGLAQAYAEELGRLGHVRQVQDLYRMGFDPVLSGEELVAGATGAAALAQIDVRDADCVTVIYPLWWLTMPAMMKGYVDRVLARGFAYKSEKGVVRGLMSGKKAVLITISGASLPLLITSGNWNAVQVLQDTHVFRSSGFDLLEHLHFDEVVPGLSNATAELHMARVRSCVRRHFSTA